MALEGMQGSTFGAYHYPPFCGTLKKVVQCLTYQAGLNFIAAHGLI